MLRYKTATIYHMYSFSSHYTILSIISTLSLIPYKTKNDYYELTFEVTFLDSQFGCNFRRNSTLTK